MCVCVCVCVFLQFKKPCNHARTQSLSLTEHYIEFCIKKASEVEQIFTLLFSKWIHFPRQNVDTRSFMLECDRLCCAMHVDVGSCKAVTSHKNGFVWKMHININPKLIYDLKVYRMKYYKLVFYNGDPGQLEWLFKNVNFFAITPWCCSKCWGQKGKLLIHHCGECRQWQRTGEVEQQMRNIQHL